MSNSCNCFDEGLGRAKAHIKDSLPETAIDLLVTWESCAFFFSGDHVQVNPKLNISYRKIKKDGTPARNLTKDSMTILCSYCPFCGRELDKS